jgi:integrase
VVKLNSRALAVLQRQKAHTFLADGAVFHCPNTGRAWTREEHMTRRFWAPTLKRLGMRYRVPYSTRHSYATMMLMAGMRPAFCARQMGHSLEMFIRVRGGPISSNTSSAEISGSAAG